VWSATNDQDWKIVEDQQVGISSKKYIPGPFSVTKEFNVAHFDDWYLREVAR
jgi:phenylpropionate dioxygenase-like ring-hydroxylating dioxygenase large terminal subunit